MHDADLVVWGRDLRYILQFLHDRGEIGHSDVDQRDFGRSGRRDRLVSNYVIMPIAKIGLLVPKFSAIAHLTPLPTRSLNHSDSLIWNAISCYKMISYFCKT